MRSHPVRDEPRRQGPAVPAPCPSEPCSAESAPPATAAAPTCTFRSTSTPHPPPNSTTVDPQWFMAQPAVGCPL